MPDCDYCGESFDDDAAYLAHLGEEHDGELSTIDRRRVAQHRDDGTDGRSPLTYVGAVLGLALVFGLGYAGASALLNDGSETAAETGPLGLPMHGSDAALQNVEQFESEGRTHVQRGSNVNYAQSPPLSGPHYGSTVQAGFYEQRQPAGALVHSLEHGAVVIYYNPSALPADAESHLRSLANEYTDTWASVIVLPHPEDDPETPFVLTAWRTKLTMEEYDRDTVSAFLAEYLGRGPENPIR
jgi:hypothetical protein